MVLISITKPLGENLCIGGFNNPFSQVVDSPLITTIEIDKSMVTIHILSKIVTNTLIIIMILSLQIY